MEELKFIQTASSLYSASDISQMNDNYPAHEAHPRDDELWDPKTAPKGNQPLYDTSTTNRLFRNKTNILDLPDISDEILSDYKINQMLGRDIVPPTFIDLDTAPNYVDFIKNTIKNVIQSESEFNIDIQESRMNK